MAVVGVALLVAVVGSRSPDVLADPKGFVFTPLVFLGDPAPGGGVFLDVFESNFINNRGDVLFGSNVTAVEEQGLFLLRKGVLSQIARVGEPAPGGGEFGPGFLSPTTLNDYGDVGFVFLLDPFSFPPEGPPFGVNAGVYRFSQSTHTATPVVRPGVTPVPGGGLFAGASFGASLNNRGDLVFGGIVPTEQGIHLPDEDYIGLGVGVFKANKKGHISSVVGPGDPAPGGGVFDDGCRSVDERQGRCRLYGPRRWRGVSCRGLPTASDRHRLSRKRLRQESRHGQNPIHRARGRPRARRRRVPPGQKPSDQ